jgi:hypothetical protein
MDRLAIMLMEEGADRPVTRAEIRIFTGISDRRARDHMAALRMSGAPIVHRDGESGYRWAQDKAELREYVARLRKTADTLLAEADAMEEGFARWQAFSTM